MSSIWRFDPREASRSFFLFLGSKQVTSPLRLNWAVCGLGLVFFKLSVLYSFKLSYFYVKVFPEGWIRTKVLPSSTSFFCSLWMWRVRILLSWWCPLETCVLLPSPALHDPRIEIMKNWLEIQNSSYYL